MRIHQALRGHDFFFAGTVSVGDVGRLAVQNNWGDLNNLMSPGHRGHARPGAAWGKGKTRRLATNRPANREFLVPVIHFSLLWGSALGVGLGGKVWNLFAF